MTTRATPAYAMPDGSYPINTCADVTKAANLAHHSKTYSFAQIKAHVMKAKAGLNCPDSVLPDTWDESNAAGAAGEARVDPMNIGPIYDPETDGSPETDDDHDFWTVDGKPIPTAWFIAGLPIPEGDWGNIAETYNYASKTKRGTPTTTEDFANAVRCPGCQSMQLSDGPDDVCDACGTPLMDEYITGNGSYGMEAGTGTTTTTGINSRFPRDNLIRAIPNGFELRDTEQGNPTEFQGIFSTFNDWYEVDSVYEGQFLERVMPGAFVDTIKNDRTQMRVLFDHGQDPSIGNKPLGPIRTLEEQPVGAHFDGPFADTDYNANQIIPLLQGRLMDGSRVGSLLGSSFRFQVQDDRWQMQPKVTRANPKGLPQRSIIKARVFEFGPVTFPANPGATASARSMSDRFVARLLTDHRFFSDFVDVRPGEELSRIQLKGRERAAERFLQRIPAERQQELAHQVRISQQEALRRRARGYLALSG